MNELELKTPKEIDLEWYEIEYRLRPILSRLSDWKRYADEAEQEYERVRYQRMIDDYKRETADEVRRLQNAEAPLEEEWARRGGWTRYWLCATDGGHVHRLPCSTLRVTSRVAWMPALSGLDEAGMVDEVGWTACTHCFPSAPLHPAWARSEAAARKASADERLAKWEKGRAMRQKKVDNVNKRIARIREKLADPRLGTRETDPQRYYLECDLEYAQKDLPWAERELARWDAKRPAEPVLKESAS